MKICQLKETNHKKPYTVYPNYRNSQDRQSQRQETEWWLLGPEEVGSAVTTNCYVGFLLDMVASSTAGYLMQ